jgi:hypothetical protein
MVEAEMADGDLGQITQAIQNALRGPSPAVHRIASPAIAKTVPYEPQEDAVEPEVEEEAQTDATPQVPRSSRPRKPAPTPEVLELDLTTDTSLASFAQKANPKSHLKRYLVVAAWFKEHRNVDAITSDHVYTCYRFLKWPLDISDFAQPLRDLKRALTQSTTLACRRLRNSSAVPNNGAARTRPTGGRVRRPSST